MSDINFDCPVCGQNMDTPVKMAGMMILCPGCKTLLEIPAVVASTGTRSRDQAKKETVRIDTSLGGIPPDPAKRRVIIKRPPPENKK